MNHFRGPAPGIVHCSGTEGGVGGGGCLDTSYDSDAILVYGFLEYKKMILTISLLGALWALGSSGPKTIAKLYLMVKSVSG